MCQDRGMPRLLIVHHTPSPTLAGMFEAVVAGATTKHFFRK